MEAGVSFQINRFHFCQSDSTLPSHNISRVFHECPRDAHEKFLKLNLQLRRLCSCQYFSCHCSCVVRSTSLTIQVGSYLRTFPSYPYRFIVFCCYTTFLLTFLEDYGNCLRLYEVSTIDLRHQRELIFSTIKLVYKTLPGVLHLVYTPYCKPKDDKSKYLS